MGTADLTCCFQTGLISGDHIPPSPAKMHGFHGPRVSGDTAHQQGTHCGGAQETAHAWIHWMVPPSSG